jgi:hypothetical protein
MVVASPAAGGPQTNESHWGSMASLAPPTPASSPCQRRIALDPLRSTSSDRKKPGPSLHSGKTKKPDRAQTSARPTAVLPGQECARSRHTRAPSGTPPAGPKNAAERDAGPPRQRIQAAPLLRPSTLRDSRLSQACGRQVIRLTTGSEACGCGLTPQRQTRPVY